MEGGNRGHRPTVKGGYFPVPPVDSTQDMRAEMSLILEQLGIPVEVFHHEVAGAGQNEIGTKFSTLVQRADWTQNLKYVVWNVATCLRQNRRPSCLSLWSVTTVPACTFTSRSGKTAKTCSLATAMQVCPTTALYYIGGIIKHARALNAITNPTTNSYKRLVPGFEAPREVGLL
jgi:glutamine synthetase